MTDYKKILDEQLGTLDDTVERQNKDQEEKDGLMGKVMGKVYAHPKIVENGKKGAIALTVGYVAGVVLPIVTGPAGAAAALLGYGVKKYYDGKKSQ